MARIFPAAALSLLILSCTAVSTPTPERQTSPSPAPGDVTASAGTTTPSPTATAEVTDLPAAPARRRAIVLGQPYTEAAHDRLPFGSPHGIDSVVNVIESSPGYTPLDATSAQPLAALCGSRGTVGEALHVRHDDQSIVALVVWMYTDQTLIARSWVESDGGGLTYREDDSDPPPGVQRCVDEFPENLIFAQRIGNLVVAFLGDEAHPAPALRSDEREQELLAILLQRLGGASP